MFEVSPEHLQFYEKVSPVIGGKKFLIPSPTLSPEARFQRRIVWRNERGFYRRKCDKTGEDIISWISPDKPYKVYKKSAWWSDNWDPRDYGRDFDFNKPFFQQMDSLLKAVPWLDLLVDKTVNSDYANFCNNLKNCYLMYASNDNEDSMYGSYVWGSKDCLDCLQLFDSQLCYECNDCNNCYECKFSKNCSNCSSIIFCNSCQNCQDCAFSVNLVGKKYCFLNKQLSESEYRQKLAEFRLSSYSGLQKAWKLFEEYKKGFPVRYAKIINSENCTGDEIRNSRNVEEGFDVSGGEDCKWLWLCSDPVKDCYDVTGGQNVELSYESVVVGLPGRSINFCAYTWSNVSELLYCVLCPGSKNCFGCANLKKAQYCILNKQYSREQYEELVPKIIEHMQRSGEWGEFFPAKLSPFGYNETLANEYFSMNKEQALKAGFNWSDYEAEGPSAKNALSGEQIPDDIGDVDESFGGRVLKCAVSGKPFRVLANEVAFYKKNKLSLPRLHPEERHKMRFMRRNPRKLWNRQCSKCGTLVKTTFSPDRSEPVYCEKCYREEVY